MKKQILNLGKLLNKKEQRRITGGSPFNQSCNTDNDCPFCHTCEHFPNTNEGICIGNC